MTDAETLRRLALIKILIRAAESNASQAPPFNADSVNRLHDGVEMFLALAVAKHHRKIPKQFMGYWDELSEALGRPLSFHPDMERLNKLRVSLKHFGIEPSPKEVENSVAMVRAFLTAETPALFGVGFADVGMTRFLTSADAQVALASAEENWISGDAARAFADLREAFDAVLADYEEDKRTSPWSSSVFDSSPKLSRIPHSELNELPAAVQRWRQDVESAFEVLDYNIKLAGLGIDLRRYGRFKALTPKVTYTAAGGRTTRVRSDFAPTENDFAFCRDFVVSTALHLDEFAFSAAEVWPGRGPIKILRDGPRHLDLDQGGAGEPTRHS